MGTKRPRRLAAAAVGAGLASVLAVGSVSGADQTVAMSGFAFDPATVTIEVGDSVTWENGDGVGHTATGSGGAFDTGTVGGGQSASVTFDTAGTFAYVCTIHPTMQGSVVVEAASTATDAPSVTPAATDAVPPSGDGETDPVGIVATLLAVLGISMALGTLVLDRRAQARTRPALAAPAHPRQRRQPSLPIHQEVAEPATHDLEVLDPPEWRPGPRQFMGLLGHAQQANRTPIRAEDREQRLGLADRGPQVALRVLDEQRGMDPLGIRDR